MTASRLVVVGEDNPYGSDPSMALYHLPRGASGDRLREHLGLRDATYAQLEKANLCPAAWHQGTANGVAARTYCDADPGTVIVMLGRKVRDAFFAASGIVPDVFCALDVGDMFLVSLPHPSGRNRQWDRPAARANARMILRRHAPWVPWGEVDGTPGQ